MEACSYTPAETTAITLHDYMPLEIQSVLQEQKSLALLKAKHAREKKISENGTDKAYAQSLQEQGYDQDKIVHRIEDRQWSKSPVIAIIASKESWKLPLEIIEKALIPY